ncbi:MAG: TetR/AcrR family transcriptional regulator [Ginsengibacter sp.]
MKDEILQTSLKQFLKYGVREMSIQKLIEPLGISTKTVYKYFKNKEELLEEALTLFHAQHRKTWKSQAAIQSAVILFFEIWHTAIEIEYDVNKAFFKDLHYYYPELLKKKDAELDKEYTKQFIQVLYKGIEQGVFLKHINPEITFMGISILYQAIAREEQFKRYRASPDEILLNTIALYIRGFCTEKGIKELDNHIQNLKVASKMKLPTKKSR